MADADPFEVEGGRPFEATGDRADDAGEGGWTSPTSDADVDHALPPVGVVDVDAAPLELVPEATIRSLLMAQGSLVHGLVAIEKGTDEWVWLEHELAAIVPPLTRIVNRYPVLQKAAVAGDPLAVAVAMGGYGRRSMETRGASGAALAALEATHPTHDVPFRYLPEEGPAPVDEHADVVDYEQPAPEAPPPAPRTTAREVDPDELDGMRPVPRPAS